MEPRSQQKKKKKCYFQCCPTTDKKLKPHLGKLMHKSKPLQRKKKARFVTVENLQKPVTAHNKLANGTQSAETLMWEEEKVSKMDKMHRVKGERER